VAYVSSAKAFSVGGVFCKAARTGPLQELLLFAFLDRKAYYLHCSLQIDLKMKILEAQSATLTNYEVYQHLKEQRARYAKKGLRGRRPGNLETVVREVSDSRIACLITKLITIL